LSFSKISIFRPILLLYSPGIVLRVTGSILKIYAVKFSMIEGGLIDNSQFLSNMSVFIDISNLDSDFGFDRSTVEHLKIVCRFDLDSVHYNNQGN
jgi:hypothetical protein